jgi:hypothetical protein
MTVMKRLAQGGMKQYFERFNKRVLNLELGWRRRCALALISSH